MSIRKELLEGASEDPIGLRRILKDPDVVIALSSVGILPKILELHAASPDARKSDGVGATLCGIRGTRHKAVTCKRCRMKMLKETVQRS
jgi:hypothetical protein